MTIEERILKTAYQALNTRHHVLAPKAEARIIWREFDPCRAIPVIATVEWPATSRNFRNVILRHHILDGDRTQ